MRACFYYSSNVTHNAQFVRPVEGKNNAAVRARYADAGLDRVMWDIDNRDTQGLTPAQVNNHLGTEVRRLLEAGMYKMVILFHDTNRNTSNTTNLRSYIRTIDTEIENYVDSDNPDKDFMPVWVLTKDRIREIFRAKWQN